MKRRAPVRFVAPAAIACTVLACALALSPVVLQARQKDNAQELTARIEREKNPVKKAKLEIRMGTLLLEQAADAYDQRQIPQGQKLLADSVSQMNDAWALLKGTGRNAAKKPDGFMQLEIALRENSRSLAELRRRVFYLYRGPIDHTMKTFNEVHAQVLLALFPGAAPPATPASAGHQNVPAFQHGGKRQKDAAGKGLQS